MQEDLQLRRLYEATLLYVDGPFIPVAGVKRMFPQLYIYFIRKEFLKFSVIAVRCAFVYTTMNKYYRIVL